MSAKKKKRYDTIIVGAGAAGMASAISACTGRQKVLLLDRLDKVGKKILATGNGKCNLTNRKQEASCYRGEEADQIWSLMQEHHFSHAEVVERLCESLGVLTKNREGYVYPYNEQASAIREAFEQYLFAQPGLEIRLGERVTDVLPTQKGSYKVVTDQASYEAYHVIITTGGLAGKNMGCDGDGYGFAKRLGHTIIDPKPALTALKSRAPFLKKLSGVRNRAGIQLLVDGQPCASEFGELQWADYGISGVAIFQLSRYAVRAIDAGKNVALSLDFLPDYTEEEVTELLGRLLPHSRHKSAESFLNGILPAKLSPVILREAGIEADTLVSHLLEEADSMKRIVHAIKAFSLRICGYVGFEKAQVTCGGISRRELTNDLESVYHAGIYFAGEVVDVDGTCGGYNLHWAFVSGMLAGRCAAGEQAFDHGTV